LLSSLQPAPTDRAAFVGQTGSGKTTLAQRLLATRAYVVVLDGKGTLDWPGYDFQRSLNDAMKSKAARILYRPTYEELADVDTQDAFFEWIFRRRNTTVYVDELATVTQGDQYPFHFGACFTRGRELNIETWCSTQRPTRIPQIVLSESEHVYCFRLRLYQDRAKVEQTAQIPESAIVGLPKQEFIYARQDADPSGRLKLQL
jgi:energy-coupling factor transporter ATP-binding protein EcfA2